MECERRQDLLNRMSSNGWSGQSVARQFGFYFARLQIAAGIRASPSSRPAEPSTVFRGDPFLPPPT